MTGFRGFRPGPRNLGLGQVTPRIVDLLRRTRTWAVALALPLFLGVAFFLALCGFVLSRLDIAALPLLGVFGIPMVLLLVLAMPLLRFSRVVGRMTPGSRGPDVEAALAHLGSFWRRTGILLAASLGLAIAGWLFALWFAEKDPRLAELAAVARDPEGWRQGQEAEEQEWIEQERAERSRRSPLVLRPARFGRDSPLWIPIPNPPAAPGRTFAFAEIGEVCRIAETTFLCLINQPGEAFGGGSRQVFTRGGTALTILSRMDGVREILEVTLKKTGPVRSQPSAMREQSLRLAPPTGFPLMTATYVSRKDAQAGEPLLSFHRPHHSCRGDGRFRVLDLAWGADGLPERLVVDFELGCDSSSLAGRLSIRADG